MQMKKLAAALMLAGLACAVAAEEVRVAVAANFMAPMKELAPLYEKATGDKLVVSYGATGAFYAQIKNGAPFDVLLAADAKTPAKAVKEGHGVAGTTFTYAVGKLVLWSSDAALVKDQKALLHPTVKKVAVADARLAPYGEAALQALDALKMKGPSSRSSSSATTSARPSSSWSRATPRSASLRFPSASRTAPSRAAPAGSFRRTSTSPSFRMPSSSRQARRTPAPSASSTT